MALFNFYLRTRLRATGGHRPPLLPLLCILGALPQIMLLGKNQILYKACRVLCYLAYEECGGDLCFRFQGVHQPIGVRGKWDSCWEFLSWVT